MKARELFEMEPQVVLTNIWDIPQRHIPEVDWWLVDDEQKIERLQVNQLAYKCPDGRRIWELLAVLFDGRPVMLTQNAGREGDDHSRRFIVDRVAYNDMVSYLFTFMQPEEHDAENIDIDEDRDDLDSFYGFTLLDYAVHYKG